jgi:hypothetical protein
MDETTQKTLLTRVEELSAVTGDCVAGLLIASERAKDLTTSLQTSLADSNRAHDTTAHVAESLVQKLEVVSSAFAADIGVLRADIADIAKALTGDSELLTCVRLAALKTRELDESLSAIQQSEFKFKQEVRDLTAAQTQELGARLGALEQAGGAANSLAVTRSRTLQLENRYYFWAVLVLLLIHFAR